MAEELPRLHPGRPLPGIPAATWNAFIEAVEYIRRLKQSQRRPTLRDVPQTGIIRLKNTTGGDRDRFNVLGVDSVWPDPADNLEPFKAGPVFHGVDPTTSAHRGGLWAILQEPAASGDIVSAVVAGVTVARLYVGTGQTAWKFADVKDGDPAVLAASTSGAARILWKETGTGVKWAVVRISNGPYPIYGGLYGGGTVSTGSAIPASGLINGQGVTLSGNGLLLPEAGAYQFGFSATLEAPAEARNALLKMTLYRDSTATNWVGYRENWVRDLCELDGAVCDCDDTAVWADRKDSTPGPYCTQEVWHTAENVAVSGVVEIPNDGAVLSVKNSGTVAYTAGAYRLSAHRLPD